jgi:hypothetical protein
MLRLALGICVLAGLIWGVGVYRMGDKTLAAHLGEIYESPLVQRKVTDLHKGFDHTLDDFAFERAKKREPSRRVQAKSEPSTRMENPRVRPAPLAPEPTSHEPIDVRPSAGAKKTPAKDALTDDDRQSLDKLLSDKLGK